MITFVFLKPNLLPNRGNKCSYSYFLLISADEDVTLSGFKEKFKTYVMVYSDGTNKWMSPATFKSSCDMRVKFYPFDTQECKLTFGSWTYDSRLLRMINPAGKYSHSGWLE